MRRLRSAQESENLEEPHLGIGVSQPVGPHRSHRRPKMSSRDAGRFEADWDNQAKKSRGCPGDRVYDLGNPAEGDYRSRHPHTSDGAPQVRSRTWEASISADRPITSGREEMRTHQSYSAHEAGRRTGNEMQDDEPRRQDDRFSHLDTGGFL